MIEELSANADNVLLLDAGNLLFSRDGARELLQQDVVTARGIYEIYEDLGYHAIAVGPYDLTAGLSTITDLSGSVPWISSNIITQGGEYIFPPWVLVEFEKQKIGIVALTGTPRIVNDNYKMLEWRDALTDVLTRISPDCDAIILLSSLDTATNQQIAEQFSDISLILTANKRNGNRPPKQIGDAITSQVQSRGRYLGVLTFPMGLKNLLADNKKTENFQYRSIALQPNLEKSQAIDKKVAEIQRDIAKIGKRAKYQPQQKTQSGTSNNQSEISSYRTCVDCHKETVARWGKSPHGRAYQTLVDKNQQYNLRCLPCHVTDSENQKATGVQSMQSDDLNYKLLHLSPEKQSVSCSACHPGSGLHAKNDGNLRYLQKVSLELCITCHTKELTADFNFNKKKKDVH